MSRVESCTHRADCAEVKRTKRERDAARRDKARFAKLCVAAQADKFKHRCLPGQTPPSRGSS